MVKAWSRSARHNKSPRRKCINILCVQILSIFILLMRPSVHNATLSWQLCLHKLSVSPGDSFKILIHLKEQRTGRESGQRTLLLMISLSKITHPRPIHIYKRKCYDSHIATCTQTRTSICTCRNTHTHKTV